MKIMKLMLASACATLTFAGLAHAQSDVASGVASKDGGTNSVDKIPDACSLGGLLFYKVTDGGEAIVIDPKQAREDVKCPPRRDYAQHEAAFAEYQRRDPKHFLRALSAQPPKRRPFWDEVEGSFISGAPPSGVPHACHGSKSDSRGTYRSLPAIGSRLAELHKELVEINGYKPTIEVSEIPSHPDDVEEKVFVNGQWVSFIKRRGERYARAREPVVVTKPNPLYQFAPERLMQDYPETIDWIGQDPRAGMKWLLEVVEKELKASNYDCVWALTQPTKEEQEYLLRRWKGRHFGTSVPGTAPFRP